MAGSDDEFNIELATADDHDGIVNVAGIENLNVTTEVDGNQSRLDINAVDMENLDISGTSGVDFTNSTGLSNLEMVDASALDIETSEGGVEIATSNSGGPHSSGARARTSSLASVVMMS